MKKGREEKNKTKEGGEKMPYFICEKCGEKYAGWGVGKNCDKCGGKLKEVSEEEFYGEEGGKR